MLKNTVLGRKALNAMLRHLAFHGSIEMPWRGEFEHQVVSELVADRKVAIRQGKTFYDDVVVHISGMLYEESDVDPFKSVHPLVVHLALDNPRNEEMAKAFRKNHVVPPLPEVYPAPEGWDYI